MLIYFINLTNGLGEHMAFICLKVTIGRNDPGDQNMEIHLDMPRLFVYVIQV